MPNQPKPKTGLTPTGRPRRSYATKPRIPIDYVKLQSYAERRMSCKEIAIACGIKEITYYALQRTDEKFRQAIEAGRTAAIATAAKTVLKAASTDPKMALEYLRRFADEWKDPKLATIAVKHSGTIEANVSVDIDEIDDSTAIRIAKMFLQTHGDADA